MKLLGNITGSEGDPKVISSGPSSVTASDKLAKSLGWFSIGLGLAELLAPGRITRALGMEGQENVVRAYGVREIASGLLTLSTERKAGLWSRVVGDGLDLATLLPALRESNAKRDNVAVAMTMVMGIALVDLASAQAVTAQHTEGRGQRRLYLERSGFPKGLEASRGLARKSLAPREVLPSLPTG